MNYNLTPHCVVKTCMGENIFVSEIQNLSPHTTLRQAREYLHSKAEELTVECEALGEFWAYKVISHSRVEIRHGEGDKALITSFEIFKLTPL